MVLGITLVSWSIESMLNSPQTSEIFTYVLPFLLVFALVYGILVKSALFGNKSVNVILSLTLGLLSLVGGYFPTFLHSIAPSLAIGLSILLVAIVMLGLFLADTDTKWSKNILITIAIIAFVIIAYSSLNGYGFSGSFLWQDYAPPVIVLVVIGTIIYLAVKD